MILGEVGRNVGAGMTGGELYVHDRGRLLDTRLNTQLVTARPPDEGELAALRELVERHERYTGSARAAALLAGWEAEAPHWTRVAPKAEVAALQSSYEGTVSGSEEEAQAG